MTENAEKGGRLILFSLLSLYVSSIAVSIPDSSSGEAVFGKYVIFFGLLRQPWVLIQTACLAACSSGMSEEESPKPNRGGAL